jgi:hypothetical protein
MVALNVLCEEKDGAAKKAELSWLQDCDATHNRRTERSLPQNGHPSGRPVFYTQIFLLSFSNRSTIYK